MVRNIAVGAALALSLSACATSGSPGAPGAGQPALGAAKSLAKGVHTANFSGSVSHNSIPNCPDSTQLPPDIWALGAAQPQFFAILALNGSPIQINGPDLIDGEGGPFIQGVTGPNGESMAVGVTSGGSLVANSPAVVNLPIRAATGVSITESGNPPPLKGPIIQPDDTNLQNAQNCAIGASQFWGGNFTSYNPTVEQEADVTPTGSGYSNGQINAGGTVTITAPDAFYDPSRTPPYIVDTVRLTGITVSNGQVVINTGPAVHALCSSPSAPSPCSSVVLLDVTGNATFSNGGIVVADPYLTDYDVLLNILGNGNNVTVTNSDSNLAALVLDPFGTLSMHDATITPEVVGGAGTLTFTSGVSIYDNDNPLHVLMKPILHN